MGYYVNSGNENFKVILQGDYIDKSGLIAVVNGTIGREDMLSCVSRPRRFGKSYAANMLAAYYDCGCDSHLLFDGLEISKDPDYETHINKYNVLYLDISGFISDATIDELPNHIRERVLWDMNGEFKYIREGSGIKEALSCIARETCRKFIAIIDEWDAPIRDPNSTEKTQKEYLEFLRSLFKSEITKRVFAAAYMTGILPIKKDGSQSAISEFWEYSILNPREFAPFTGFTEEDVQAFCQRKGLSFEEMKVWYDGYALHRPDGESISVYNPNSVIRSAKLKEFDSYWGQSSAVYGALDYINLDFNGLGDAAERLTAGFEIRFETEEFQNDLVSFQSADDVLTLLTHFGYLTYDTKKRTGRIPNHEIMAELIKK